MSLRPLIAPALGLWAAASLLGCGPSGPQPTDEERKNPEWIQAKLKEIDREATIKPTPPSGAPKR